MFVLRLLPKMIRQECKRTGLNVPRRYSQTVGLTWPKELIPKEFLSDLNKTKTFDSSELQQLKLKILNNEYGMKHRNVSNNSVDSLILHYLRITENYDGCRNYYQLIKDQNMHFSLLGKILLTLGLEIKNYNCPEKNKDLILEIYQKIKQQSEILDPGTAESCIGAIVYYEELWRDVLPMLENMRLASQPSSFVYSSIIYACLMYGEVELAWQFVDEVVNHKNERKLGINVFYSYVNYCTRLAEKSPEKAIKELEKFYSLIGENEIYFPFEVATDLKNLYAVLNKHNNNYSILISSSKNKCNNCKTVLSVDEMSVADVNMLLKAIFIDALVGKNIFIKSTPEEVEKFMSFMDKNGPYDIVIDGLNVACALADPSLKARTNLLQKVVKKLVDDSKKVLVLGRKHMLNWPKQTMNYILHNADVFFAEDLSHDDPFLLYATLKSGSKTGFVSRDLMRNHLFNIKDKTHKKLFRIWCSTHRYEVDIKHKGKLINIIPPGPYIPTAHQVTNPVDPKLGSCWHIRSVTKHDNDWIYIMCIKHVK